MNLALGNFFYVWMAKKYFCFFQTTEAGRRKLNSSVKGTTKGPTQ